MYRYFLALRYLLSRPINLLGMIGITIGVWSLIVVVSIFSGYLIEVQKHVVGGSSDLTALRVPDSVPFAPLRERILADPNVAACAPRVIWHGLLHAFTDLDEADARADASAGVESANGVPGADGHYVTVLGVDAAAESEVSALRTWLDVVDDPALRVADLARPLAPIEGDPAVLISKPRALLHGLRRGDRILLASMPRRSAPTAADEPPQLLERTLRIGGCFESSYAGFDGINVFVSIETQRDLLRSFDAAPGWVDEISIRLRDGEPEAARATAGRLSVALNADLPRRTPSIVVRTSTDWNAAEIGSIEHQRGLMKLVLFVIMVVAAFLVFATLSMMVTEKTHDIGILTAIGATRRGVLTVFLACGVAISLAGIALGVVTGCLSAIYTDAFNGWLKSAFDIDLFPTRIYNLDRVPCDLDPQWIMLVSALALGVGILVSGIPAWRASRHDPLQSLRNE